MLQLDHDPRGLVDTIGDNLGFARRQAKSDLERFKQFIEERGTKTGGWRGNI